MIYEGTGSRDRRDGIDDAYAKEARSLNLLTKAEEQELARRIQAKGHDAAAARDEMIRRNLRLVIHMARRYRDRGLPFDDIVQHGNMGLMIAVDKFDPRRGHRLSTYATWWIRQAINAAILDTARIVRVPRGCFDTLSEARKEFEAMRQETGREPEIADVAARLGENPERLTEMIRGARTLKAVSLDAGVGCPETGGTGTLGDMIEAPDGDRLPALDSKELLDLFSGLSTRQRLVLTRRFGLDGRPEDTLQELATKLGLSRERVRQIEYAAIRHIRKRGGSYFDAPQDDVSEEPMPAPVERRVNVRAILYGGAGEPEPAVKRPAPARVKRWRPAPRASWDEMFAKLQAYKRRFGDCRVPRNYWPDPQFGNWVTSQKTSCRHGIMSERRMRLLVSIGFSWSSSREHGESMIARLEAFHAEHGHLRVPPTHPHTDLYAWCRNLKRAAMSPARLRRLERISFPWGGFGDGPRTEVHA